MSKMFDPHRGQWWSTAPEQMFQAYYMTLRVHYGMPAKEAFDYAKEKGPLVGVGRPGGVIGLIKEALS